MTIRVLIEESQNFVLVPGSDLTFLHNDHSIAEFFLCWSFTLFISVQQFEEKRRKSALHKYYKELKKSGQTVPGTAGKSDSRESEDKQSNRYDFVICHIKPRWIGTCSWMNLYEYLMSAVTCTGDLCACVLQQKKGTDRWSPMCKRSLVREALRVSCACCMGGQLPFFPGSTCSQFYELIQNYACKCLKCPYWLILTELKYQFWLLSELSYRMDQTVSFISLL